jgi:iron complex transport system substrate-binding protein
MRIASLVPSSTETRFSLGLGDRVVAVTHECDYPRAAAERPHLTRGVIPVGLGDHAVIPEGLGAAEIDRAVRGHTGAGQALYELHGPRS